MRAHTVDGSPNVPHPVRATLPLLVLAVVGLALVAAPELPDYVGPIVAGIFAAGALARFAGSYQDLRQLRAGIDRIILRNPDREPSGLVVWRSEELTTLASRRVLAHEIERLVRASNHASLPNAVPVNRPLVRAHEDDLRALAERLADPTRNVSARGVLLVRVLLGDPEGPLYERERSDDLAGELERIARALDGVATR
jgi:hypothetical protein